MRPRAAKVSRAGWLLLLASALSCGTMVESSSASTRKDGGLACDLSDPCACAPCTDTDQCAEGLSCNPARRRGESCPGALLVCSAGQ